MTLRQRNKGGVDMRLLIAGALFLLTVLLIVFGLRALFHKDPTQDDVAQTEEEKPVISQSMERLNQLDQQVQVYEATMRGVSGYSVQGLAHIELTPADFSATIAASLPAIDGQVERYEAWAIQPGIADYFSLGTFFPRADGWYGLAYEESRVRVPESPETYTRILITRETLADDGIPSNIRIAEGFLHL